MKRILIVLAALALLAGASEAKMKPPKKPDHRGAKTLAAVVSFPVRHPVKTANGLIGSVEIGGKYTFGSALLLADIVFDAGVEVSDVVDKVVTVEFMQKTDLIHYISVGFAYADQFDEALQDKLLGSHN